MSFLADLIADFATYSFAQTRSRAVIAGIGVLAILLSSFLLYGLYSSEPASLDSLIVSTIEYDQATVDSRSGSIVLKSNGVEDYTILDGIWKKDRNQNELIEDLNTSNSAKIWLSSEDSREIQGIETSSVYIDPAKGIEWNKSNDRIGIWLCWTFLACGIILIIFAFKYY